MRQQSGFTLVELAIALMVIGLLIGGVLKGQELIQNARITRTIKDLNDYQTAVMLFQMTYKALPGDIKNTHLIPDCNAIECSESGDRNYKIGTSITTNAMLIAQHGNATI